jgi:DNA-binding Lrp family transcriptional regulator
MRSATPKLRSRAQGAAVPLDEADKRLLNALQSRFPLDPRPFAAVAAEAGMDEEEALARSERLLRERIIREIRAFVGTASQHDDMTMLLLKVEEVGGSRLPSLHTVEAQVAAGSNRA